MPSGPVRSPRRCIPAMGGPLRSHRSACRLPAGNTPVFVASGYIPKGTPVSVIGSAQLLSRTTVPASKAVVGAITDPSVISGEVAASNIYPGQQLAASDFTAANVTVASLLTGNQRAIAIPLDSAHGLVGVVQTRASRRRVGRRR